MIIQMFVLALAFLPAPVQVLILGVFAFIILFLAFKLIAFVLDCIPFL